jgi:RNA polymerase sigma factor FliA
MVAASELARLAFFYVAIFLRGGKMRESAAAQCGESELICEHMDFALKLARAFAKRRAGAAVGREDFEGAALLGLCDAAKRFEPSRGMGFKSFAYFRVRGAMIDLLRRSGELPRYEMRRKMAAFAAEARRAEDAALGGELSAMPLPYAKDLAELGELADVVAALGIRLHVDAGKNIRDITYLADRDGLAQLEKNRLVARLQNYLTQLGEKERKVLHLRYGEGCSLEEIRPAFGNVSKSWLSRLHVRALERLRELFLQDEQIDVELA